MSTRDNLLDEITAANRRFMDAFRQDDFAGVAACYTEDAQLLIPHMEPVRGRAAIEAVFRSMGGQGHTLEPTTLDLEGHGDAVVEMGHYARRGGGGETLDRGKYIVIWCRAGADWRMHYDMVSTSLPRPA